MPSLLVFPSGSSAPIAIEVQVVPSLLGQHTLGQQLWGVGDPLLGWVLVSYPPFQSDAFGVNSSLVKCVFDDFFLEVLPPDFAFAERKVCPKPGLSGKTGKW